MRQGRHGLWKPPVPSGLERSLVVFGEADSGAPVLGSVRSAETCWFNMTCLALEENYAFSDPLFNHQ